MKKIIFILPILLTISLVLPADAITDNGTGSQNINTGQQIQQQDQTQLQLQISPSPTGSQIKNQNQTKIINQADEQEVQNQGQEQEKLEVNQENESQNRNQNATQNMSIVALKVQELLELKTTGGIGEQVRIVAREQNQAQTQIQEQITKLDSRSSFSKLLFGPDLNVVKNLKSQLEQNQLRVQQFQQLKNQLYNQTDIKKVTETIQALKQENTTLQERILSEEQTNSLFGWVLKLFNK